MKLKIFGPKKIDKIEKLNKKIKNCFTKLKKKYKIKKNFQIQNKIYK